MRHSDFIDDDYPEGIAEESFWHNEPAPVSNLVFGICLILLGLSLISTMLFAVGSFLEWGGSLAVAALSNGGN